MGRKYRLAGFAACSALASQSAQATNSIYIGDCARATEVHQQSTVDTVVPHSRYEGVLRLHQENYTKAGCNYDQMQASTLTQVKRTKTEVVFNVSVIAINFSTTSNCMVPEIRPTTSGTVTFTTHQSPKGDLCEVYIWSDWNLTHSVDPNWKGSFKNRAIPMEGGSFVIAQSASDGLGYRTPLAFTGVSK